MEVAMAAAVAAAELHPRLVLVPVPAVLEAAALAAVPDSEVAVLEAAAMEAAVAALEVEAAALEVEAAA